MKTKIKSVLRNSGEYLNFQTQSTSSSVEMVTSSSDPTALIDMMNVYKIQFVPIVGLKNFNENKSVINSRKSFFGENIERAIKTLSK